MLHWGSVLLKQLYNLDLKFKDKWPKKGKTIKTSFLVTVIKILIHKSYSYLRYINLIQKSLDTLVY